MTRAHNPDGLATPRATDLVPAFAVARGHRGRTASARPWRPSAPFVAQMVGEREQGNRLSRARGNVNSILDAYGEAAQLQPRAVQQLDCFA